VRWPYGSRWDAAPQAVTGTPSRRKAASSARAPPVARARPTARTPSRSRCARYGQSSRALVPAARPGSSSAATAEAELPHTCARGAAGVKLTRGRPGQSSPAHTLAAVKLVRVFGAGARPTYVGLMSRVRRLVLLTLKSSCHQPTITVVGDTPQGRRSGFDTGRQHLF
jgi:hypothetical protein